MLEFMTAVSIALIAVVLGVRLVSGNVPFEEALVVLLLAPEFYRPLRELAAHRHAAMEGKAAAERILEILGTVTERDLLVSKWELTRDRAMLLITHRLVGMEEMDEILVMDAGRVIERGAHEQLLAAGGLYPRMLATQQELLVESCAS